MIYPLVNYTDGHLEANLAINLDALKVKLLLDDLASYTIKAKAMKCTVKIVREFHMD